jgi:UDP-2,4-diacetamido-2,4,6-trideoxy-beta-L-altropyranose hydrolase
MTLDVLIRADASTAIGSGHIARTSALAHRLRRANMRVGFACRQFAGDRIERLRADGFPVFEFQAGRTDPDDWLGVPLADEIEEMHALMARLDAPPTWVVVDHYALDYRWEVAIASRVPRIFVIDDLANRQHCCVALLDHNYHQQPEARYAGKVLPTTKFFVGPTYALLRDEFFSQRRQARRRGGQVARILIMYGGFDQAGYVRDTMHALAVANIAADVDCIVPADAVEAHRDMIAGSERTRFRVRGFTNNVAALMNDADLAIGAAGVTNWERCFLGLPSIVSAIAPNQEPALQALGREQIVQSMGTWKPNNVGALVAAIRALALDPERLRAYSQRSFAICGDVDRGASEILAYLTEPIA